MRWIWCMVASSGAMKSAAYPAKKTSAATPRVNAMRPFNRVSLSFLYQKIAQKPSSGEEEHVKTGQETDPGAIERRLLSEQSRGRFRGGDEHGRQKRQQQQGQQQFAHARVRRNRRKHRPGDH